ncbi:MAG TPA: DMT family transporter [Acidimicrobiia bacterium]|nr:DMT family transporter [Acidimicrobiia bacterium]
MNPWAPLIAAILGWGSGAVVTRALVGGEVDTFTMLPFRLGSALVVMLVVLVFWKRFRSKDRRAWRRGVILGTFAMAIPMILLTIALEDLPVSLGGLLIALVPIFTIAAAHFIVPGERFNPRSVPGLILSLAGTAVLVGIGGDTVAGVGNLWRGVTFSLAGVILAGVGGALSRRYALEVGGDALVIPQFTAATLVLFLLLPILGSSPAEIGASDWILILALGILGTTIPFTAFLVAAEMSPASRLAVSGYLVPVVAVLLAVIFLSETLSLAILVGAVFIIGGVVMAERATPHVPEPGFSTAQ